MIFRWFDYDKNINSLCEKGLLQTKNHRKSSGLIIFVSTDFDALFFDFVLPAIYCAFVVLFRSVFHKSCGFAALDQTVYYLKKVFRLFHSPDELHQKSLEIHITSRTRKVGRLNNRIVEKEIDAVGRR